MKSSKKVQKKIEKKKAKQKQHKKDRNILKNMPRSNIVATELTQSVSDNYKSISYENFTVPFIQYSKLIISKKDSVELQSMVVHSLNSLVAYTPHISRQQLNDLSIYTNLIHDISSKSVVLTGYISDAKFGIDDRGMKQLINAGNIINPLERDSVQKSTLSAILLSCPQILNQETHKYEIFEDSHVWLYLNRIIGNRLLNQDIYLGDKLCIAGTILKYDSSKTNDGYYYKWGIDTWTILSSSQNYVYNNRVHTTPVSISRLVPLIEIRSHKKENKKISGTIALRADIDSFTEQTEKLKQIYKLVRDRFLWVQQKG